MVVVTLNFVPVPDHQGSGEGVRDPRLDEAAMEGLRVRFGLDSPSSSTWSRNPWTQFTAYIATLMRGDLGSSYACRDQEVTDMLGQALVDALWLVLPPRRRSRSSSA